MSVISLKHYLKRGQALPSYLGIKGSLEPDEAFALGSRVMQWSEEILLIDLSNVYNYWKWAAQGEELLPFFERKLKELFGETQLQFCFAHHPFQAVLNLKQQEESFTCLGTPQGDLYFRQQDFRYWESALEEFGKHIPSKELAEFRKNIGRFNRFLERMKINRPFDILNIKQDSLERRFGKWLGRVWSWVFKGFEKVKPEPLQGDLFQTNFSSFDISFPWQGTLLKEMPFIKRFLDHPLIEWEHMCEPLVEDMNKLLKEYRELRQERVTRINWVVTLESLEEKSCSIIFRNPHSLLDDAPKFETFLFQAYYSYLSMMKEIEAREDNLDFPIRMATVGWRLEVQESLRTAHLNEDLLSGSVSSSRMEMENKLPLSLQSFGLRPSFFPEVSFGPREDEYLGEKLPWLAASKRKPLFIFNKIEPLVLEGNYKKTFLERVSTIWWHGAEPELGDRDYYLIEDNEGIMWWAFQEPTGGWFKHGLFS
ncbi:MAG: hypothetical protein CME70_19665 [Halobacteriovorax sp.]|nr:hypothetical protein [Halobacteriovorax sp.]|tara:strand:+ start:29036 stop:30478 length:1443 start_codon:yes stop_codon:yes gene_type:complete